MPKISIIIPVYGVEKYIDRCARSLFNQTFESIEYIFVDDCTRDKSIEILEDVIKEYPSRAPYIRILHHSVNKGLPQARRTGVLAAKGDYILHCDSDDWLEPDTCELLYNNASEHNSDVVVCDIEQTDGSKSLRIIKGAYTEDKTPFITNMMYMKTTWSLVNKLFRRDVYNVVKQYPEANISEDMALCLQLIQGCSKISYVNKPLYKYFVNMSSMSQVMTEEKILNNYRQCKSNVDLVVDFYSDHVIDSNIKAALEYVKFHCGLKLWGLCRDRSYLKMWMESYPHIWRKIFRNKNISLLFKLKLCLTYLGLYPRTKDCIIH